MSKKLLVLPGFSQYNKEWADDVGKNFENDFELPAQAGIYVHYWRHWQENYDNPLKRIQKFVKFEAKTELEAILEHISDDDDIYIVAKSIGTYVAMHFLENHHKNVKKVVLCGIPLKVILGNNKNYYKNLKNIDANKIIVFQNSKDPYSPYDKINKFIKNIDEDIKVIKKDRDDHEYPFYEEFKKVI